MACRHLFVALSLVALTSAGCSCGDTPPKLPPGSGCIEDSECESGLCQDGACVDTSNPVDGGITGDAGEQPPACLEPAAECTPGATPGCCSGMMCFSRNGASPTCGTEPVCKTFGESCLNADDCCSRTCLGTGKCGEQCKAIGTACSGASDCCSGICNTTCQAVPNTTPGKATVGEPCTSPTQCASNNCQSGFCFDASWCRANGDICYGSDKCCSGLCSKTDGTPGVCTEWSVGGIGNQKTAGMPCASNSECYSQLCLDVGLGTKVCILASGCREMGEICKDDEECCGFPAGGQCEMGSGSLGQCGNTGGNAPVGECCKDGPDAGSNCQNGNSCEDSASAQTCRQDLTGAFRCFGGGETLGNCPLGYNGADLNCCIAAGAECQFRDQCCNFQPCLWNGTKFACSQPSCVNPGQVCTVGGTGSSACCSGLACVRAGEVGEPICRTPVVMPDAGTPGGSDGGTLPGTDGGTTADAGPTCKANDVDCASASECCSGTCLQTTHKCAATCLSEAATCAANSDCCAGSCINNVCRTFVCINDGSACSGSADCCSGNCEVNSTTGGICKTISACSTNGAACSPTQSCCTGLRCFNTSNTTCTAGNTSCVCKFGIN